jgi:hypothetical protein
MQGVEAIVSYESAFAEELDDARPVARDRREIHVLIIAGPRRKVRRERPHGLSP